MGFDLTYIVSPILICLNIKEFKIEYFFSILVPVVRSRSQVFFSGAGVDFFNLDFFRPLNKASEPNEENM